MLAYQADFSQLPQQWSLPTFQEVTISQLSRLTPKTLGYPFAFKDRVCTYNVEFNNIYTLVGTPCVWRELEQWKNLKSLPGSLSEICAQAGRTTLLTLQLPGCQCCLCQDMVLRASVPCSSSRTCRLLHEGYYKPTGDFLLVQVSAAQGGATTTCLFANFPSLQLGAHQPNQEMKRAPMFWHCCLLL